ncbi:MAG: S24/S26 family peptidase [Clostridia bacterium]|nr:S24/S26 family peptidase [Clostridia bacterium]
MKGLEETLKEKGIYITTTKGDSMNPMLVEGRDKVVIVPPKFPLKKYDVPVYRKLGHYTMHRIVKVKKNGYIICGDNRTALEKDVRESDIVGVLEGFYQGDKYVSAADKEYLKYAEKTVKSLKWKRAKNFPRRVIRKLKRIIKGG